jgi:hypothetical protein
MSAAAARAPARSAGCGIGPGRSGAGRSRLRTLRPPDPKWPGGSGPRIRQFVVGTGGKTHYGFRGSGATARSATATPSGSCGWPCTLPATTGASSRNPARPSPTAATAPATDSPRPVTSGWLGQGRRGRRRGGFSGKVVVGAGPVGGGGPVRWAAEAVPASRHAVCRLPLRAIPAAGAGEGPYRY